MDDAPQEHSERSRPFNLNMLPVLRELLRLRNVTQAAAALNMSQSAVSDALSRLRNVFEDELLIPSGRGFVLSERAQALEPLLTDALEHIEIMLNATAFDPKNAQGRIHLATSDFVALTVGTVLVRNLRAAAPGIYVQFHDADEDSIGALAIGHLDFILMPDEALTETPSDIEKAFIFEDQLVLTSGAGASGSPDPAAQDWSGPDSLFGDSASSLGFSRPTIRQHVGDGERETIVLPAFMLLPFVAAKTDITTLVHRRLAERLAPAAGTKVIEPAFPLPTVRVFAAWKRSRNSDPLHRWLLAQMIDIGVNLDAEGV